MRSFLHATLALASLPLAAQTATFSLTLTPEANGSDTRVTWSYTGAPTIGRTALTSNSIGISGLAALSGAVSSPFYNVTGDSGTAFTTGLPAVSGLNTGLVLTNTTTQDSRALTRLGFFYVGPSEAGVNFNWAQASTTQLSVAGDEVLVLSGPSTGSFLTGIVFSNFTLGTWTLDQGIYLNFDPVLTVSNSAPIPEPSTYGLILGGLALAGAAVRRRQRAK